MHIAYDWLEAKLPDSEWASGDSFTLADCAAAPALFYADWVDEIGERRPRLKAYRARLLADPSSPGSSMKPALSVLFPAGRARPGLSESLRRASASARPR